MPGALSGHRLAAAISADLSSGTYKWMLLKSTYTPNPDHQFASSLASTECDATGYTGGFAGAGRLTPSGLTVTYVGADDEVVYDADDPTWTNLGGATNNTLRFLALIREITDDASSPVVAVIAFNADTATVGTDYTVQLPANGFAAIDVAVV
jgi:hypothetical protein